VPSLRLGPSCAKASQAEKQLGQRTGQRRERLAAEELLTEQQMELLTEKQMELLRRLQTLGDSTLTCSKAPQPKGSHS